MQKNKIITLQDCIIKTKKTHHILCSLVCYAGPCRQKIISLQIGLLIKPSSNHWILTRKHIIALLILGYFVAKRSFVQYIGKNSDRAGVLREKVSPVTFFLAGSGRQKLGK